MLDTRALAQATADIVREHVEKATAPLLKRIDDLERRQPVNGKDGVSVTVDDLAPLVADAVTRAVADLPAPKNGEPGADGKDGESVGLQAVEAMVSEAVERAVAVLPAPKDGRDGIGVAGALIDRAGSLVLTLSNGEARDLGTVVGADGKDGLDGADGAPGERGERGFSLESFDTEMLPDGRTVLFKFVSGEHTEIHELAFPVVVYRGVFKEGTGYEPGDEVTWAGSAWHCTEVTTDKPGDGSKSWVLKVKRGRDGRDGKDGERGEKGLQGPPGRDLTQLGLDGAKW